MIEVNECPICSNNKFTPHLTCKDHTVSKQNFQIKKCSSCGFLLTSPRPINEDLGNYYVSDEYISHTNQSKTLFDKVYQISRLYALKWKLNILNSYAHNGKSLLDVGCGTGAFITYCHQNNWEVSAVEPSSIAIKHIEENIRKNIKHDIEQIENKEFDTITLWHVLEHLPNLNESLREISKRLNQKGTLFIAVPNPESWDQQNYTKIWAAYDVPRHLWHFTRETMSVLLSKHGLNIVATKPMKLDAYYVSLLSEKIMGKPKIIQFIKGFINGLKSNLKAKQTQNYSSILYIIKKA